MTKLEIKENKKLVLKKVIIKELRNINIEDLDSEINKFTNELELLHAQGFGPLVTRNIGTSIHEDGSISMDYDIFVQAHDYELYRNRYNIASEHICEYCLYVRFEGKAEDLNYAYSKLDLYAYEEELEVSEQVYLVFVNNNPESMIVDIFKPVVRNETL